eukprot:Em0006g1199a
MFDRRENKKDTSEAYTQALQKVFGVAFQPVEDAMVYPQSFCSSCKCSLQKAMDAAAKGVPYKCCVTAFQWQKHSCETCMDPRRAALQIKFHTQPRKSALSPTVQFSLLLPCGTPTCLYMLVVYFLGQCPLHGYRIRIFLFAISVTNWCQTLDQDHTLNVAESLPSFEEVCELHRPTLRFIPSRARPAFARVLSASLRSVLSDNSEEAWLKLFMLPKCVLPSSKRRGRNLKPTSIETLCKLWSDKEFGLLWNLAKGNTSHFRGRQVSAEEPQRLIDSAISLAKAGMFGKACGILLSAGIAPNNDNTWKLLLSKHPSCPPPQVPRFQHAVPISIGPDFNILGVLQSFPKGSAAGPSGLRIQHLLDAASIPLPTSICSSLRDLVNLLSSGKAPTSVSTFLAGGSLTALNKFKPGCLPDVRPIAVGEALRRLTGKCLCSLIKYKASEFFQSLQFGVACASGSEQVILDECALHFPELLPWATWCYAAHPLLWHPMGRIFSETGVQQGNPLGPLLFALVLQKILNAIDADDDCIHILYQAWYLDDGTLAGKKSAILRALSLLDSIGPSLGIFKNMSKCELFCKGDTRAPIGDYLFCGKNAASKRSEALKLLSRLVENPHLSHMVDLFNKLVSPPEVISVDAITTSPVHQRVLSKKLEDHQFSLLLEASSPADKARLLSVSAPHAASWLLVTPSPGLNLHLDPNELQISIQWWLGIDTARGSSCSLCPGLALDRLGNHATTSASLSEGAAVEEAEVRKHRANDPKCSVLGWVCIPLAVETYGNWGREAQSTFSRLASHLAIITSSHKIKVLTELYSRLNFTLVRAVARALLARCAPSLGLQDIA